MRRKFPSLMQHKNPLVVFGCSWACGVGVVPNQSFGNRLSTMLGSSQFTNCAIPGSSNNRSVLELLEYIRINDFNVKNHVAVFCITTAWRTALIKKDKTILDIIDKKDRTDPVSKTWIAEFSGTDQVKFELHKNIICMQQICRHYQMNDFYIKAWEDLGSNFPGIDQTKIYPDTCISLFNYKDTLEYCNDYINKTINNPYILNCGHPSIAGHIKIAEVLYDWMKDKIV